MNKKIAHWRGEIDADRVAWLALDKAGASTNSLSRDVMEELDAMLTELAQAQPKALIITSAKRGFIAGADIKEFVGIRTPDQAYELIRQGQQVLDKIAALPCPTIAAINGFALGGGLEVALACRYRVLVDDPSVTLGFPEVQLGVHPGFGGTVRAVHLAGPVAAMDLMLTGRTIRPQQALAMGLVDRLAPVEQLDKMAKQIALRPPAPHSPKLLHRVLNSWLARPILAGQMRSQVARRARPDHYPAPYAMITLWQRYGGKGQRAYEAEARSMAQLLCTQTSRNLVRVFFLQDRVKSSAKAGGEPARHVHVVGAGVMGGDIATWCATRGLTVTLQDRGEQYIAPAIERARKFLEKRYPDQAKRDETLARLQPDVEGHGVAKADIVIEAIFEDLNAKRELFARIEPKLKPLAVLATNTSSIVLEQLAQNLAAPERLIGLHFFNPVARMPLVEVIHAERTQPRNVHAGLAFARQIDKLAIACRSSPGFLVNRVLMPYLSEAVRAAEEGIPLALIDRAAEDFGMPMGPIELADVVGLDVVMSVGKVFFQSGAQVPHVLSIRYQQKKFGKKSGEGFYVWQNDKPQKPPSAAPSPPDLQDRLLLPLLNEAVAVLREHLVEDADLIDAGVIFGAGFAPFRGGPIQYARTRGVDEILARLEELRTVHGDRFAPDAGWQLLR
ncbi:MAG TPA: 3-hydroxyacyl-CoA dehydrogenase NAD-binding domain-containing protein [Steroidobacteraceae bacterium]|jgi:3-hydroxyacyl-CoA dehydrogenase/enoyl-CoA hydratase/3-hydroxybutyryl-CoA epimerase|nr:3-hydroxyacyl-CoA dehydrogenase NAD-binding domain-containing protein [Steroidobacteraceae bacterium]